MESKKIYLIIGVVILVLVIAGFFVWWKYYKTVPAPKAEEPMGLGSQIYEQVQNPAEKIPETNPFEKIPDINPAGQTNPFKDVKTNPFR